MRQVTSADLSRLANANGNCLISMYAPMQRAGREVRQNAIRWKNLLRSAREEMTRRAQCSAVADAIFQMAESRLNDDPFWQHQGEGLACFFSSSQTTELQLPETPEQIVYVGNHFLIAPLLKFTSVEQSFLVLAVSSNRVRLIRFFGDEFDEVRPESLPTDLNSALNIDEYVSTQQLHTAMRGAGPDSHTARHHGQGGSNRDVHKRDELQRYFQILARAIDDYLSGEHLLLIFAGVDYLFPLFREACGYRSLSATPIVGNPDELSAIQLRERAQPILDGIRAARQQRLVRAYQETAYTDWSSSELREIMNSARLGQVDTLLLSEVSTERGGRRDLARVNSINEAVVETLKNRGQCVAIPEPMMPDGVDVAAVFRSPAESTTRFNK